MIELRAWQSVHLCDLYNPHQALCFPNKTDHGPRDDWVR